MTAKLKIAGILFLVIALSMPMWVSSCVPQGAAAAESDDIMPTVTVPIVSYYAKYDGVTGEAIGDVYDGWIELESFDWGISQPDLPVGPVRRRADVDVEDITISLLYEKAAPKLAEGCLKGKVYPKLEIEMVGPAGTFLRYEMLNVMVTSYAVTTDEGNETYPVVVVTNNFEEIKVTYRQYDQGTAQGNVEYSYKIKSGS